MIIEDSGMGFRKASILIFSIDFTKLTSPGRPADRLGLYISRTILAAHGQRITVGRSDWAERDSPLH